MKRMFRILALMIAAVCCCMTAAHAADSYIELDGFSFDINDKGEAVIHEYNGDQTDIVIPQKLLRATVIGIDDYAFYNKELSSVSFDAATGLRTIGSCAFYGCADLSELSLPSDIALSFGSFQSCTGLGSLTISDGIGVIPEQCFYQCTSLTEITLPDSVTKIDVRAFGECEGLRYMYLSASITDIAPNAFEGDDDLIIRTQRGTYAAQYGNDNGIRVEYPYAYLLGDANGDSHVDVLDVTLLQRVLANVTSDPDGLIALRGCVSGEELSSIDVTSIQRCLAYVPTPYPVAERTSGWASAEVV